MSGSWEDIANEVVPVGVRRGGLATGAMRSTGATRSRKPERPALYHIPCPPVGVGLCLEEVLRGAVAAHPERGSYFHIRHVPRSYHERYADLEERLRAALRHAGSMGLRGSRLEDTVFLDIETTGLSSETPLFLIGALCFDQGPCLEFFLARGEAEERAALSAFRERTAGRNLVTFNGNSFDWPYIKGRGARHGVPFVNPPIHHDLLPLARQLWRGRVPNCRLQTLEEHLCGRNRIDDTPSGEIPRHYRRFASLYAADGSGAHLMGPIVHHNALDILTMTDLLCLATID